MSMPDWAPHLRPRLSSVRLSPAREAEIIDELSQHLEDRWRELVAGGASEAEAGRLTLAELREDNLLATSMAPLSQARTPPSITPGVHTGRALSNCGQDLRYAWRLTRRRPGFTVVAALTLALGIGANSAIFSLVDVVLLRSLPVDRPEQLVLIEQSMARGGTQNISRPLFERLREEGSVFSGLFAAQDGLAAVNVGEPASATASAQPGASPGGGTADAGDRSQTASVEAVSGEYFQVLGTSALVGRVLTSDDDRTPGAHPVAVLSHNFWTRRLGGDPGIIGRTITLARHPFTIVGVTRPGFFGEATGRAPEIWVPMMMHPTLSPGPSLLGDPRVGWLQVIGRLKPGVTHQQADAVLTVLLDRLKRDPALLGGMPQHIGTLHVTDGRQGLVRLRDQFSQPLRILTAAVGVVLLIACANVATLLLARASTRQREIAIRVAIGAGRRRLVQQLMTEGLLLGAIGGSLGLLLSWWGSRMLLVMAGAEGQPIDIDVTLDLRLLAFTTLVSSGAVILFALVPALSASRAQVNADLKQTRSRLRLSPALVIAQVALSLPLIAGAALFLQTLHNLRTRDLGFAAGTLVQVRTNPQASGYTPEQTPGLARRIVERLGTTPGVRAVSVAHSGFGTGTARTCCIAVPGRVFASDREREVRTIGVGPGYFATVSQRLRVGREFAPQDLGADPSSPMTVAIVNEAFIRQFLGEGNPIGQYFGWGDPPKVRYTIEVIGVVNDAIYDQVRGISQPLIYFASEAGRLFVVRAAGAPADLVASLRREIQAVEPKLIVTAIAPVSQDVERTLLRERLLARLAGFFGALAAALAAIGLYGLMSYAVANRTREIGIRMALGAPRGRVLRTELWSALRLVAIGIAIGIPAAVAAGYVIAAQLFGVTARDPVTLLAAAAPLALIAALAAYGPALRASRVDPMSALRSE
jgi:predicted permease